MGRIEWAGVIGVGALVIILISDIWLIQCLAAILVVALARPMYRAITQKAKRNGQIQTLKAMRGVLAIPPTSADHTQEDDQVS